MPAPRKPAAKKPAAKTTTKAKAPKTKEPEAPAKPGRTDWEAVERDYRAGKLTLREIGAKHGISNGRVAQKAKEKGWVRGDLQEQVKKATQALLIEDEVSKEVSRVKQGLSTAVVATAELNKQIILQHRGRAARAVDVCMRLLNELDATTLEPGKLEDLLGALTKELPDVAKQAAFQQFRELMRLHNRVGSAQKIMAALKDAQSLEAEAFGGLYDKDKGKEKPLEQLSDDEIDARLAALEAKAKPDA